jgi:hypothetical protein
MCAMVFSFKELKSLSKENCSSNSRVQVHLWPSNFANLVCHHPNSIYAFIVVFNMCSSSSSTCVRRRLQPVFVVVNMRLSSKSNSSWNCFDWRRHLEEKKRSKKIWGYLVCEIAWVSETLNPPFHSIPCEIALAAFCVLKGWGQKWHFVSSNGH